MGAESANLPPRSYGDEMCRAITAAMVIDAASEAERAALPVRLAEARRLWDFALAGGRMGIGAVTSAVGRSEEHTSELQSLMRNSYAVFCVTHKKALRDVYGQYRHD